MVGKIHYFSHSAQVTLDAPQKHYEPGPAPGFLLHQFYCGTAARAAFMGSLATDLPVVPSHAKNTGSPRSHHLLTLGMREANQ
jgi:hypothetical protein